MPKFTYWESLTPEPLLHQLSPESHWHQVLVIQLMFRAVEPRIFQCDTGLTSPNQKWMYDCLSDLIIIDLGGRSTTLVTLLKLSRELGIRQEYQVFCLSLHHYTDLYHSKSTHHCQIGKHTHHQFSLFDQDTL